MGERGSVSKAAGADGLGYESEQASSRLAPGFQRTLEVTVFCGGGCLWMVGTPYEVTLCLWCLALHIFLLAATVFTSSPFILSVCQNGLTPMCLASGQSPWIQ